MASALEARAECVYATAREDAWILYVACVYETSFNITASSWRLDFAFMNASTPVGPDKTGASLTRFSSSDTPDSDAPDSDAAQPQLDGTPPPPMLIIQQDALGNAYRPDMTRRLPVWRYMEILAGTAYLLALFCVIGPWLFDLHSNLALVALVILLLVSPVIAFRIFRSVTLLLYRQR